MSSIRNAAELGNVGGVYGVTNGTAYGCGTLLTNASTGIVSLILPTNWPSGVAPSCASGQSTATGGNITTYAMSEQLSTSGVYACVDSTGVATTTNTAITTTAHVNCSGAAL